MRKVIVALACAALAACQQHQSPKEITFDGALTTDKAAMIRHGERLTHVLGCTGCHGAKLQGERFYELFASNLTRDLPKYSDAQFELMLRGAHRPSHIAVWGMPSHIFQNLSEPDVKALLAYLRTLPPGGTPDQPMLPLEPETKAMLAKGLIKPEAEMVRETKGVLPADLGPQYALGRYITAVTCAECHGLKLEGDPSGKPPNLIVAGGYSRPEFDRLITQGIPTGGRKISEMMSGVAQTRFNHLTPHERDALYAYLKARAEKAR
jgi:cytochrome c553